MKETVEMNEDRDAKQKMSLVRLMSGENGVNDDEESVSPASLNVGMVAKSGWRECGLCEQSKKKGHFHRKCPHRHLKQPGSMQSALKASSRKQHKVAKLLFSAAAGDLQEIRKIVRTDNGASINNCDYDQRSALMVAAAEGHLPVVKYLVDSGAHLNAADRWGSTAITEAVRNGHPECVDFLQNSGCSFDQAEFEGALFQLCKLGRVKEMLNLIKSGINPNCRDNEDRSLLHIAAREGHNEIVEELIRAGADIDAEDAFKRTALCEAFDYDRLETATLLELHGAKAPDLDLKSDVTRLSQFKIDPDDLTILEKIGQGGFADVYKAKWKGLLVAAKIIRTKNVDQTVLREFIREVEVISNLRHPHVLLFLGVSTSDDGNLTVVTEFMEQGSLANFFERPVNPLSFPEQLRFAHEIALGLQYLHSVPIMHRDLKPGNIFISDAGHLKIGDFGLSVRAHEGDDYFNITGETGSYRYMAPENFRHQKYDRKVDVYSYAMIIYELFTWEKPFGSEIPVEVAKAAAVQHRRPPMVYSLHPTIIKLITQCWHRDPAKRPEFDQISQTLAKLREEVASARPCCILL